MVVFAPGLRRAGGQGPGAEIGLANIGDGHSGQDHENVPPEVLPKLIAASDHCTRGGPRIAIPGVAAAGFAVTGAVAVVEGVPTLGAFATVATIGGPGRGDRTAQMPFDTDPIGRQGAVLTLMPLTLTISVAMAIPGSPPSHSEAFRRCRLIESLEDLININLVGCAAQIVASARAFLGFDELRPAEACHDRLGIRNRAVDGPGQPERFARPRAGTAAQLHETLDSEVRIV